MIPVAQRFWSKLRHDAARGCWLWTGATSDFGHGVVGRGARGAGLVKTHRLAWELTFGAIPDGMSVLHRCDVPECCNPGHLFLGTQADNMRDMSAKGRASAPKAQLNTDQVHAIRRAKADGAPTGEIAERFGIKGRQVRRIVSREQWRHVA